MEEMLYVFLFTFFSLSIIFTLVTAGISPFSHRGCKIFMFFTNEIGLLWFLCLAPALSLLSTSTYKLKLSRKKELASVVVVFISKRSGSYTIYRRNARVLEMQNFIPAYMNGWTYVRTVFSETKFLGCTGYQFSYPWCSAARARGPLKSWVGCAICCAQWLVFQQSDC